MRFRYGIWIIATLLVGAGIYALVGFRAQQPGQAQGIVFTPDGVALEPSAPASSTTLGPHREAPSGYVEYYNYRYRFSLLYPGDLHVSEHEDGGGAATVTFQNPTTAHGFQLFVVPYGAFQVTEERFNKDEPSGVRNRLRNVTVDGSTAASFYSSDAQLGETAEIWFIRGGYLYEATTLKSLDAWLSQIMQTWKFL